MARPKSTDKQVALLKAAVQAIASDGLGAPTSKIAKLAGVAEGTLFRYYATKDELINEVYLYLINLMNESIYKKSDPSSTLYERTEAIWNNYIDWGVAHPVENSAISQLAVSEKITAESHERVMQLCIDLHGKDISDLFLTEQNVSTFYVDAVMNALAQVTVNFVISHPAEATKYKQVGFKIMWKGLTQS
ncbi:TetR/AcrR family transcriptional regulator [Rheinheimera texasensis]|uniref:TetR/AcrR family transcriptional regulator n=1 Tax=Rheinheimera texasensis TaxID=306205 RepID=UPI0004E23AA4|nr:TetR/AcrR family transcriptional regulator [Rheinheimera texasensis]